MMKSCHLPDGRRLSWRETGWGPALVMLHGWGLSSAVFTPIMTALGDHFRVLAPDLRGHGRSAPGPGYALDDLAGDLALWLDIQGLPQTALLGWSLGGMVALHLESSLPARVTRLILVSTTPCFVCRDGWPAAQPQPRVGALARQYRRNAQRTLETFFISQFQEKVIDLLQVRAWAQSMVSGEPAPDEQAALESLATLATVDLRADLGRANAPSLIVHGGLDTIIPPAAGRYLAEHRPNSRFILLPEVGHAPFLTRQDEMLACWRKFLT